MFKLLLTEMLKGKSLLRTLTNDWVSNLRIEGQGIDLGARNSKSSYFRFIQKSPDCKVLFTDLDPQEDKVIQIDLEKKLTLPENSQDFLLLMHVLEHLFDYQNCINESYRILKPGKQLIGCVPFLYQVHADPEDHFRYTQTSLQKILQKAGFQKVEIVSLGYGPFSTGVSQYAGVFKFKIIVFFITWCSILLDKFFQKIFPNNNRIKAENFPLAYGFIANK